MPADVVDRNDTGVVELSGEFCFREEPVDRRLILKQMGKKHLEGHDPLESDLAGLVNDAHRARPISRISSYWPKHVGQLITGGRRDHSAVSLVPASQVARSRSCRMSTVD